MSGRGAGNGAQGGRGGERGMEGNGKEKNWKFATFTFRRLCVYRYIIPNYRQLFLSVYSLAFTRLS